MRPSRPSLPLLVSLTLLSASAACGSDDDDPGGGGGASATIEGTLGETEVSPATAFLTEHPLVDVDILVMPEVGETCVLDEESMGVVVVIGFPCGVPEVGEHPVSQEEGVCDD